MILTILTSRTEEWVNKIQVGRFDTNLHFDCVVWLFIEKENKIWSFLLTACVIIVMQVIVCHQIHVAYHRSKYADFQDFINKIICTITCFCFFLMMMIVIIRRSVVKLLFTSLSGCHSYWVSLAWTMMWDDFTVNSPNPFRVQNMKN